MTSRLKTAVAACLCGALAAVFSFYVELTKPEGSVSDDYCKDTAKCTAFVIQVEVPNG